MMLEEVPCDKESNHQSINGFWKAGRYCKAMCNLHAAADVQLGRNEPFRDPSSALEAALLQLEQHEPFVAVDDSATLMVVPCIERPLLDADSCAASAFLLTV